jgi:hypothetical protein
MVKIEAQEPRWRGLQAVKTDLVRILGKLDYVIDPELLNCIRLGLELHLSLLSIYKECNTLGVKQKLKIFMSS